MLYSTINISCCVTTGMNSILEFTSSLSLQMIIQREPEVVLFKYVSQQFNRSWKEDRSCFTITSKLPSAITIWKIGQWKNIAVKKIISFDKITVEQAFILVGIRKSRDSICQSLATCRKGVTSMLTWLICFKLSFNNLESILLVVCSENHTV